ncbi:MAG: zinc ABC transporter substrate-binding protein [Candidatus Omnitrophota bacterium]|nr:zinc ABC transporter substrate-binding protein [Candidatus Omnitrophota bacterium]
MCPLISRRFPDFIIAIFSLVVFFPAAVFANAQDAKDAGGLQVVTTLFPTYDFAKQVGKDKVNVSLLLPPGIEAHAFEPKPSDIVKINKADIFIYTGKYMEPWVEDALKGVSNRNLLVVDASAGIEIAVKDGCRDPHIWLDLGNAQVMVERIAKALARKDPANSDFYSSNAREYNTRLAALDKRFKETLSGCRQKTLIYGGHSAFGYFARRYGLRHDSPYAGFSPDAEPTPKAIAKLVDKIRQSGMKHVFHEELLDPKVARTIASETGAHLMLLHGAHNVSRDELKNGATFLQFMEEDLDKLKIGLECK